MDYLCLVICLLLAWVGIRLILTTVKKDGEPNLGRLPPGPPGLPIFGNLLSLGTKPHITVTELAKTYGPFMCLQLGRVPTVVISSAVIAKEALQKNDQLFSNRMVTDALHVFSHHEDSLVLLPTSSRWRNLRKICNSLVFSSSKLDANRSIRREKVNDLLSYVQNNSEAGLAVDICQAVSTTMLNLLSNAFFSTDLGDPNTEMARGFKETVRGILEEAGKPNFADYFPILKKIDPQGIRRRRGKHYQNIYGLLNSIIDQRLQEKRPTSSEQGKDVLDALLDINQEKNENFKPAKIPNLLLDLFIAGTDTTSTTLEWAMAELLRHPEKLKKARVELQEAIGNGKPVEESDISRILASNHQGNIQTTSSNSILSAEES